jgi:hypothetical protein
MIRPDEIKQKATNLYAAFLRAWISGESFFPKVIPCRKRPEVDLAATAASVRHLREESKAIRGYGYSVEWTKINSRTHGKNHFPTKVFFETESDFLRYIGKQEEFRAFAQAVSRIRSRYPELQDWIRSRLQVLIESAGEVDGLLEVVDYLRAHPRPGVFARELPISVDTKFVERNRRILREWLDRVLPPHVIRADEEHFERRFGFRYVEPQVMLRFLDPEAQHVSGCPWPQLSLPLHTLSELAVAVDRVIVVENKINLLTLSGLPRTLAIGGLGNGVTDLRYVSWLASVPLWYWGDLDVEGFVILARLRSVFPHARSVMMDTETLAQWRVRLASSGSGRKEHQPSGLVDSERAAFAICLEGNLRLEQERLPQEFVNEVLQSRLFQRSHALAVSGSGPTV